MRHQTLEAPGLQTIAWVGDALVDWACAGQLYGLDGERRQLGESHYSFSFDRALTSTDGQYAFLYQKLGTKGLLLKNGEMLREINRSYYHAETYEYPAAFVTVEGTTYLVHCPVEYCQLDFENVETGELVTNTPARSPTDFFHSRLEISPGGTYLMSKGWYWHPWNGIQVFDIWACLRDPLLLDNCLEMSPETGSEISSAGFVTNNTVLLVASGEDSAQEDEDEDEVDALPPGRLAVWNVETKEFSPAVSSPWPFGNVFPIDENRAWDLYQYPKIIDIKTGEVLAKLELLNTGRQSSSIIRYLDFVPAIVFNPQTKRIAVKIDNQVEVLSVD
ncbi:hypothetical protein ACFQ48_17040 [Hymenobacter caeli]|uniref:T9SS C-terminal target domain-containing protein n=1 Tax=Hymenobacter caeli TaxID=2735894 RepID=A0ABX2FRG5_9BACT|nr:hypothetical protein [Hymenobacter caeli]NRT19413.1 hypothetical protein [Hymenobacter caeli]